MTTQNSYPEIKRFIEIYEANPEFQQQFVREPQQAIETTGLTLDPLLLKEIIKPDQSPEKSSTSFYFKEKEQCTVLQRELLHLIKTAPIKDNKFNEWRMRQMKRIKAIYHDIVFQSLPHIPVAYELTSGCSVGCPFCCFDPPNLQDVFQYNTENRKTWISILETMKEIIGELAGMGSCYFATEPLDNPHYEQFVEDFHAVNGKWPQLTTAKAAKEPERIKKYLHMIGEWALKRAGVRFSILSLNQLKIIHELYSPEELRYVDLILLNKESSSRYSPAGRARKLLNHQSFSGNKFYMPGPVSCISGFVINLVTRKIILTSTCNPDEDHPYGYILFDELTFENEKDFKQKMVSLIENNMVTFPGNDELLSFHPVYHYEKQEKGIRLSTKFIKRFFPGDESFVESAEMINKGKYTWNDIQKQLKDDFLINFYVKPRIKQLFDYGMIDEEK